MTDRLPAPADRLPATNTPLGGDLRRLIHVRDWMVDIGWNGPPAVTFDGILVPWHPVGGRPDWLAPRETLRALTFRSWCEITDHFQARGAEWLEPPMYRIEPAFQHLLIGQERNRWHAVGHWRLTGVAW